MAPLATLSELHTLELSSNCVRIVECLPLAQLEVLATPISPICRTPRFAISRNLIRNLFLSLSNPISPICRTPLFCHISEKKYNNSTSFVGALAERESARGRAAGLRTGLAAAPAQDHLPRGVSLCQAARVQGAAHSERGALARADRRRRRLRRGEASRDEAERGIGVGAASRASPS